MLREWEAMKKTNKQKIYDRAECFTTTYECNSFVKLKS
jgi:hypothetical protein